MCPVSWGIEKPKLMLAKPFSATVNVADYWVSEKLDGVRARWDGQQLISRSGHILKAPSWFISAFPDRALDGELWGARGKYQKTVSIVSQHKPHNGWAQVKFMLFDLPEHTGTFSERVIAMGKITIHLNTPYLQSITQFQVTSQSDLMRRLETVIQQKGEGLMLQHKSALYEAGRSHQLLKLKDFTDADAKVIGYRPGKGRLINKMGAIKVKTSEGSVFYIGSGFNYKEREKPPEIGSTISFRHQGKTDRGIPRFAVFLRVRDDL